MSDDDDLQRAADQDPDLWYAKRQMHYERSGEEISLFEWVQLIEDRDYVCVAFDRCDDVEVSTVWLGLDHDFRPTPHAPIIFETMVFGGPLDQAQRRYATEAEAFAGHAEMLADVRAAAVAGADPKGRS